MTDFNPDNVKNLQVVLKDFTTTATATGNSLKQLEATFAKSADRVAKLLPRLSESIDSLGNRYIPSIGNALVKRVVSFDARINDIATRKKLDPGQQQDLKQKLFETSSSAAVRMDVSDLLDGFEKILSITGDLDLAAGNLENIGTAARATGASTGAIGTIIASLNKLGINAPEQVFQALDTLVAQSNASGFNFKDQAAILPSLIGYSAKLGFQGQESLKSLGGLIQLTQKATGNIDETQIAISAILRGIKENAAELEQSGIQVFDNGAILRTEDILKNVFVHLSEIESQGGKPGGLAKLFGPESLPVLEKLQGDYLASGKLTSLDQMANAGTGNSQMIADAIRQTRTMAVAIETLDNALTRVADENLSAPIQALADAVNNLSSDELKDLFDIAGTGAKVAVGIWAVNKALRTTVAGFRLFQALRGATGAIGGKGNKLANGLATIGATPVRVTNWPTRSGFDFGNDATTIDTDRNTRSKSTSRPARNKSPNSRFSSTRGLRVLGRNAGKLLHRVGPLAIGLGALDIGSAIVDGNAKDVASSSGSLAAAIAGGELGAWVGTMAGPIGIFAGALIGSGLGAYLGEEAVNKLWDEFSGKNSAENTSANTGADAATTAAMANLTRAIENNTRAQGATGRRQRRDALHSNAGALEGGQP